MLFLVHAFDVRRQSLLSLSFFCSGERGGGGCPSCFIHLIHASSDTSQQVTHPLRNLLSGGHGTTWKRRMLRQFVELCIPLPPPPAYHFDRDIIRHFDANDGHGTRRTCIISVLMWWFSRAVITFNVDHKVHHITIISAATSNIPQDMRYSCFFAIQSSLLPHYWSFLK